MKWMITILFLASAFGTRMQQPEKIQLRSSWLNTALNAFVDKMSNAVAEKEQGNECQTLECYMLKNGKN